MKSICASFLLLFLTALLLSAPEHSLAIDTSRANNIFGIHVATPSREELSEAAGLVNSSGGQWGYVTVVIQENDRDVHKWQEAFDQMRELHLIPIVRLATSPIGDYWRRPEKGDVDGWVSFLNSLNWVVKDRYVVLFNEPNHGQEWGGGVDIHSYADVSEEFVQKLHEVNNGYFVMLAGFDAAAPASNPMYEDEFVYLQEIMDYKPELLKDVDGWSSHSYPNPGFMGSPYDSGRNTVTTYSFELQFIRSRGYDKELPVFITETGWIHNGVGGVGVSTHNVANDYLIAFDRWSQDGRIRAVTPFILSYQGQPFLSFSWKKNGGNTFYDQYYAVQGISKVRGNPEQDQKGSITALLPAKLFESSIYRFSVRLENKGQAIWDVDEGYSLSMNPSESVIPRYFFSDIEKIAPQQVKDVNVYIKTAGAGQAQNVEIKLQKDKQDILAAAQWHFKILPLPTLQTKISLFPRLRSKQEREFEVQIFDQDEQLVFKQQGLKRLNGEINVGKVHNIYVGGKYRVVVLSKYYLPRQGHLTFSEGMNNLSLKPMLPFDFYPDGAFTARDLWELITHPAFFGLFLP